MKLRLVCVFFLYSLSALSVYATPVLGTASSFSVLATASVTNTGNTVLAGSLGVYPGTSYGAFPPGVVNLPGTIHAGDAAAQQAEADALSAYNYLENATLFPVTQNLTGQDLGGKTLTPGVYTFNSSAGLNGQLTLNTLGNPNALFIFRIGSSLTTGSASSVITSNGTTDCCNVYWLIGSSATLGTTTDFRGNILASISITLNTGANITDGRALALNGSVTLDDNHISNAICDTIPGAGEVPEPGTVALLGAGLLGLVLLRRTSRKRTA